jgi:hypothetical protein
MAQKEVISYICDNCGAEEVTKNSELPFHWVEVQYRLHYGTIEKVDLCDDCREAFDKALEERRSNSGTKKEGETK